MAFKIEYDAKFCDELVAFFDVKERTKTIVSGTTYDKEGNVSKETYTIVAVPPPHIGQFARKIGVPKSELYEWAKKYPEFGEAVDKAKGMRRELIIDQALVGNFDARFSELAAINLLEWGREPVKKTDGNLDAMMELTWKKRIRLIKHGKEEKAITSGNGPAAF